MMSQEAHAPGTFYSQKPVWRNTLFPACWRHQEIEASPQNTPEPFLKAIFFVKHIYYFFPPFLSLTFSLPLLFSHSPKVSKSSAGLYFKIIIIWHLLLLFTYLNYMHYLQFLRTFIALKVLCTSCRVNKSIYITN